MRSPVELVSEVAVERLQGREVSRPKAVAAASATAVATGVVVYRFLRSSSAKEEDATGGDEGSTKDEDATGGDEGSTEPA